MFSVFGGAHGRRLNTLKLFFWQNVLLFFFFTLMKMNLLSFQDFVHTHLLVLSSIMFSHYNTLKFECNKGLFLDVNQKDFFLAYKKFQRPQNLRNVYQK